MGESPGMAWARTGLGRRATLGMAAALVMPHRALAASVTDARKRRVAVTDLSRVVCVGGAITEIVYALGVADHVVAVDSTSRFPPAALTEKSNIGYMRSLAPEGILALRPTLILAMNDAGPPQALDVLAASGIPLVFVDATLTPQAVAERVRFLAEIFRVTAAGERLCTTLESQFAALSSWRAAHPARKRVLFVLSIRYGRLVVGGAATSADAIITLAGGINAAAGIAGYKPVSDEALTAMAPDALLAMDNAGPGSDADLLDRPGFRLTPAGRRRVLIRMDGEFLLGLGPRTPLAALELAKRLVQV